MLETSRWPGCRRRRWRSTSTVSTTAQLPGVMLQLQRLREAGIGIALDNFEGRALAAVDARGAAAVAPEDRPRHRRRHGPRRAPCPAARIDDADRRQPGPAGQRRGPRDERAMGRPARARLCRGQASRCCRSRWRRRCTCHCGCPRAPEGAGEHRATSGQLQLHAGEQHSIIRARCGSARPKGSAPTPRKYRPFLTSPRSAAASWLSIELTPAAEAVAQAHWAGQSKAAVAALVLACLPDGLQPGVLDLQVGTQPGRAHRARGQAGDTGELDHVLVLGRGQHLLELFARIAFFADGEGRAQRAGGAGDCSCAMSSKLRMPPAAISGISRSMPALFRKARDCGITFSKSKRGSFRSAIFAAPGWPPEARRGCSMTMASGRRFLRSTS